MQEPTDAQSSPQPIRLDEEQTETGDTTLAGIVGAIIAWLLIGFFVALGNDTSREFMKRNVGALVASGVALVVVAGIALGVRPIRQRLQAKSPRFKAAMLIFVAAPALLALVGTVAYYPPRYQVTALRIVFLLIVCLLPPILWYLFIATRKSSLLNDYLTNLNCLGLLQPRPAGPDKLEDESSYKRRLYNYLEKFEAVYGPLPNETRDSIVANRYLRTSLATDTGTRLVLTTAAIPVLISTALFVLGWVLTLPPVPDYAADLIVQAQDDPLTERWVTALTPAETSVSFAFLGAYFFGIQMLFRRYIRNDLAGGAYVQVAIRVVLGVIGAWVATAVLEELNARVTPTQYLVVGFTVGFFPPVVWELMKKVFRGLTGILPGGSDEQLPLPELDGMTLWHEVRLVEEDIENVPNMASVDVVELLLKTRFPAERIVDWIDQAILLTHLGRSDVNEEAREVLRRHGIRSASSLVAAATDAKVGAQGGFINVLEPPTRIPALLAAIRTSPNFELVQKWKSNADLTAIDLATAGVVAPLTGQAPPGPTQN